MTGLRRRPRRGGDSLNECMSCGNNGMPEFVRARWVLAHLQHHDYEHAHAIGSTWRTHAVDHGNHAGGRLYNGLYAHADGPIRHGAVYRDHAVFRRGVESMAPGHVVIA